MVIKKVGFLRFIVGLILFVTIGLAKDISYNSYISSKSPYIGEAIFLDFNVTQEDDSVVMRFKFNLKESKSYSFHQVEFRESDEYHHLKHQYRYLIYPKEAGEIAIELELIKSLTDDDKVAYAISGDRDNVKGLVKKDIIVSLKPVVLNVKPLPKDTQIVGDYRLIYSLDKNSTDAYDPVHLEVLLKGEGDISPLELLAKNKKYNLFTEAPNVKKIYTKQGVFSSIEWDYAISAKENFVLPKVVIKAFNPKSKKSYELTIPSQTIAVKGVKKELLLDREDTSSIASSNDWSWLGWLFSYFAVFMAGVLMPRDFSIKSFLKKEVIKERSLEDEIVQSKSHKELLKLLLAQRGGEYKEAIRVLEEVLYNGKKVSLSQIKRILKNRAKKAQEEKR